MNDVGAADLLRLLVLALPVAAISWTITHEELFREVHDYCVERSRAAGTFASRKFFYLFTCEYCFSHYAAAGYSSRRALRCFTTTGAATSSHGCRWSGSPII